MSNHGVATVHGLLGHMELSYTQAQATAKAAVAIGVVEAWLTLLGLADCIGVSMLMLVVTDVLRLRWLTFMLAIRSHRCPAELER